MPKPVHEVSRTTPEAPVHPADLEDEMQETLDTLADVELAYKQHRKMLDRWSGSAVQKARLSAELEKLYQRDRQPLIMRLADLHECIRRVTPFRTVH